MQVNCMQLFLLQYQYPQMQELKTVDSSDLIIIITTSPIQSNPSTQVIDMCLESIFQQPALADLTVHIVCDGVKLTEDKNSKYKSGIVSHQSNENYQLFKIKLKQKYSQHKNIVIEQRTQRYCFAQNIRHVMAKYGHPFVLIFQHDHVFQRKMDIVPLLEAMRKHPINYIGFMNKSVNKLPHTLDQNMNLRKYFVELTNYKPEVGKHNHKSFVQKVLAHYQNQYELPLMPLLFWYDKVHIAKRQYYMNVIFNQAGFYDEIKQAYFKVNSFVQDSFGTAYKRAIRKRPSKFEELRAFILWDSMEPSIYHVHGRNFITQQTKQELYLKKLRDRSQKSSEQSEKNQEEEEYNFSFLQKCSHI